MHTRFDMLVLLIAAFGLGALFAGTWVSDEQDAQYVLIQSATQTRKIKLNQTGTYRIKTTAGHNDIEIKDHSARFSHANCPRKICLQQGWLSRLHPVSACVPNGLSIQLSHSSQPSRELDAYAF